MKPLDADTLSRLLQYATATAAERVHLRPGNRPLVSGLGGPREIGFRQLCAEDTREVAGHFLEAARVSERIRESSCDAAREIFLFMLLPDGTLAEAVLEPCRSGVAITIELIPPLPPEAAALLAEA
ncbi:MAG: hypothetical protein GY723_14555 [bacterium]|nr:hypothetical protein [bacterium]